MEILPPGRFYTPQTDRSKSCSIVNSSTVVNHNSTKPKIKNTGKSSYKKQTQLIPIHIHPSLVVGLVVVGVFKKVVKDTEDFCQEVIA